MVVSIRDPLQKFSDSLRLLNYRLETAEANNKNLQKVDSTLKRSINIKASKIDAVAAVNNAINNSTEISLAGFLADSSTKQKIFGRVKFTFAGGYNFDVPSTAGSDAGFGIRISVGDIVKFGNGSTNFSLTASSRGYESKTIYLNANHKIGKLIFLLAPIKKIHDDVFSNEFD